MKRNRAIKAEPLTYTAYFGRNKQYETVSHYATRDEANRALDAGQIASWETRELTAAEYVERFRQ